MKLLFLSWLLCLVPGGEREKGLQLYRDGHFPEAVAAFKAAIEQDGDSAELQWNLALACYGAGDLAAAETAAEKYAAMAKQARPELHAGMLGAVRHGEAKSLEAHADKLADALAGAATAPPSGAGAEKPEDPLAMLEQALAKAKQANDYFERGVEANATPELLRNAERSLGTIAELEHKIEELKKQREEQPKDDSKKDDKKDDKSKQDDKKDDKDKKDEPKKDDEPPKDDKQDKDKDKDKNKDKQDPKEGDKPKDESKPEPGEGEEKPEPKPEPNPESPPKPEQSASDDKSKPEPTPEPKPSDDKSEDQKQASAPRQDAPGEATEGKELPAEEAQRMLEKLQQLDEQLKAIRARAKSGRRAVERDW